MSIMCYYLRTDKDWENWEIKFEKLLIIYRMWRNLTTWLVLSQNMDKVKIALKGDWPKLKELFTRRKILLFIK